MPDVFASRRGLVVLPIAVAALAGCAREPGDEAAPAPRADGPLVVAVVNHPLEHFARRIGGDRVEVVFPAPADGDPAFWTPGPEAVGAYQRADLILRNGAGYAGWIDRVTLPASRLVDTSASFADRLIAVEGAVTHQHGPGGAHSHGALASTTWLDPDLALEHARAVRAALVAARPDAEATFDAGLARLEADLKTLDDELRAAFDEIGDAPLLASHPVYQYLAARYDLDLRSVHFEPDAAPDEAGWRALEAILETHPARLMLWEGDPLPETAARLGRLGVAVVVFDPCGKRPARGDWMTTMRANAARLAAAAGDG